MTIPTVDSSTSQVVLTAKIEYYNTISAADVQENIVVLADRQAGKPKPTPYAKVVIARLRYQVAEVRKQIAI